MRKITMIPFGELAPDQRGIDSLQLHRTLGMIPVFGTYRSVAQMLELSSRETQDPINGSHVHLVTPERSNFALDADEDKVILWTPYGDPLKAPEDSTPAHSWWRIVAPADESTGIEYRTSGDGTVGAIDQYNLSDGEDPNTDEDHYLRFRYKVFHPSEMGAWQIFVRLFQDPLTQITEHVVVAGGDDWETAERLIPSAHIASITDYTALWLEISAQFDNGGSTGPLPVDIIAVVNQAPELWEVLPEEDPVLLSEDILQDLLVDTYLEQAGLGNLEFEALLANIVVPDDPQNPGTDWELRVDIGSPDADIDFDVEILELGDEIYKWTDTQAQGAIAAHTQVVPEANIADIEDYTVISLRVTARSQAAGATQTVRPDETKSAGSWTPDGGATLHAVLSDENNNTFADSGSNVAGTATAFKVGVPSPAVTPSDAAQISYSIRTSGVAGNTKYTIRFGSGGTQHLQKVQYQTGPNKVITGNGAPSGVDWNDAWIEVIVTSAQTWEVNVKEAWLDAPEPGGEFTCQVAQLQLDSPTESPGMAVCFAEFDPPISEPLTPGDEGRVYAGHHHALYDVSNVSGFQDRSKTSDNSYGALTKPPTSWRFCSWGNRVVATNGSDPVQWQEDDGERFVDLLDLAVEAETEIFTARFCSVSRDFLFLGNCLHPTDPAVGEYTVWWSAINNPRLFKYIDLTTMSDQQALVTTAGAITGQTGGEFTTIFKRTSIYRATFVGPPIFWDMQVISYLEGTGWSESIVQIDRDHFFFGSGGFRHLPYGGGVKPIGDGKITKMFIDKIYEDRALKQFYTDDLREVENSLIGCYDQWSRLVFWLYRGIEDNAYGNKMGIIYNPWEDRWSMMDWPREYSHTNALPPLPTEDRTLTRGLINFGWDARSGIVRRKITYERSIAESSYPVHIQTKKMSTATLAGAEGFVGRMHGLRPIVTLEEALGELNFQRPIITVTVVGALDVHFTCDVVKVTVATGSDNENDNGWLMFDDPVPGEYFIVDIDYEELEDELLRELIGFEVDVEIGSSN